MYMVGNFILFLIIFRIYGRYFLFNDEFISVVVLVLNYKIWEIKDVKER